MRSYEITSKLRYLRIDAKIDDAGLNAKGFNPLHYRVQKFSFGGWLVCIGVTWQIFHAYRPPTLLGFLKRWPLPATLRACSITTVAAFRPWRGSQSSNAKVPAEAIESMRATLRVIQRL